MLDAARAGGVILRQCIGRLFSGGSATMERRQFSKLSAVGLGASMRRRSPLRSRSPTARLRLAIHYGNRTW